MKNHELRLANQHAHNRRYLENLTNFINSPRFLQIPAPDRALMLDQVEVMHELDKILTARMISLNLPV